MEKIAVIGAGPGSEDELTFEARAAIGRVEWVYAAERHARLAGDRRLPLEPLPDAIADMRERWLAGGQLAVLVSGDASVYSFLPALVRAFGKEAIDVVAGVGALQAFCAVLREVWQGAAILSAHGRELPASALAHAVRTHERTFLYCDDRHGPGWACEALSRCGVCGVEAAVGERLGYPDERVSIGPLERIRDGKYDALCMVRLLNPDPRPGLPPVGIADGEFLRGSVPMTKREVRALAMTVLMLRPDSIVWDVGAGTGSVAIECARQCPEGAVLAVERDEEALSLIRQNADRFFADNVRVVAGTAPGVLSGLPVPTHVFLGGSGGEMDAIVTHIERLGTPVRLVATAVTLESAYALVTRLGGWRGLEAAQVAVNRLEPVGGYHMFRAQNPVIILSADWEGVK